MSKNENQEKEFNTEKEILEESGNSEDTNSQEQSQEVEDQEEASNERVEADEDEKLIEQELGEAKDKYLRLYSEFENFRRRTSKEKLELINTANRDLMSDILPVLDDFERALKSTDDTIAFLEGVRLIHSKLNKSLTNKGLKKMEIEKGDDFDEELHEAITQLPAEKKLEGKIVDVVEPGYVLGDKVIRFAKVVVGSKQ